MPDLTEKRFDAIPKGMCTMKNVFVPLFHFIFYWYLPFAQSKFSITTKCHFSLPQWEGTLHWYTPKPGFLIIPGISKFGQKKARTWKHWPLCWIIKMESWLEGLLHFFASFFSVYTGKIRAAFAQNQYVTKWAKDNLKMDVILFMSLTPWTFAVHLIMYNYAPLGYGKCKSIHRHPYFGPQNTLSFLFNAMLFSQWFFFHWCSFLLEGYIYRSSNLCKRLTFRFH